MEFEKNSWTVNNAQTHRKILHTSEFSDNTFRTQINIVSFRATDTTGKEGKREAEGAPLKPHFRRIDFQVLSCKEKRSYACNS